MPTRESGVTFWPRNDAALLRGEPRLGDLPLVELGDRPAAEAMASRNSGSTAATAASISSAVTRKSVDVCLVERGGVLAQRVVAAGADLVDDTGGNAEDLGIETARAGQVRLGQALSAFEHDTAHHVSTTPLRSSVFRDYSSGGEACRGCEPVRQVGDSGAFGAQAGGVGDEARGRRQHFFDDAQPVLGAAWCRSP
jgi:hypothetical protein